MMDLKIAQTSYIAFSTRSTTLFKTSLQFRPLWNKALSSPNRHFRKSSLNSIFFILLFAIISALLSGTAAYAQLDQGTLAGTVHDTTGAAIPNATVTLVDEATGLSLARSADSEGIFTFTPIKIGSYKVTVSAQGFSKAEQKGLIVNASARIEVPITLAAGSVTQTVEVTTDPAALQTDNSSTGATIPAAAIVQTPLVNRNPIFIAQLTPGVAPTAQGTRGTNGGDFSANGQRTGQNNYIFDGVDNNAMLVDEPSGAAYVIKPIPESLAEFKVQTSSYNAELGRAAGAVVIASMKSGSSQIHGSLWEYWRNDILNARDYFEAIKPKYRQNQFGAAIGGPILKDKLFFFGDVEGNRVIFDQSSINTVPTLKMRTGDFSELLSAADTGGSPKTLYPAGTNSSINPNPAPLQYNGQINVIDPKLIDPVAQGLFNLLPAPNFGVPGQTYSNFQFQGGAKDNTVQYDGRLDWNLSQKDQIFTKYSVVNEQQTYPSPFGILDGSGFGTSGNVTDKARQFTLSETHFFTSTLANEFRVGYNWINAQYAQPNSNTDLSPQFGLGGIPFEQGNGGLPFFNFGGGQNLGTSTNPNPTSFGSAEYLPTNEFENVAQLLDNVSKTIGKHSLKIGFNLQRIRIQTLQIPQARGYYDFTGKFTEDQANQATSGFGGADFLLDEMNTASVSNFSLVHDQRWYRSAYFQDDWRVSSALTLNMGLRYDYFQPFVELNGRQANFLIDYSNNTATYLLPDAAKQYTLPSAFLNELAANNVPVVYDSNPALTNAQKVNFGPRLGFAYSANDKLVIRGGYGLFFGGFENVGFGPNLALNAPFLFTSNFSSAGCSPGPGNCATNGITLENGFSAALSAGLSNYITTPSVNMYPKTLKTAYTQGFNLALQQQLAGNSTVTVAYVGALGVHITSPATANQIPNLLPPGASVQNALPFNQFAAGVFEDNEGSSNFNSLQVTGEHRSKGGLYFMANYTWSKSLDDTVQALGGTNASNYRNWRQLGYGFDYGPTATDTRHRFVLNTQYQLPVGNGRKYLNQSRVLDALVGGFNLSLLFRVETGQPNLLSAGNNPTNGAGNADAVRIGDPFGTGGSNPDPSVICATKTRTVKTWFNPCAYTNPPVAVAPPAAGGALGPNQVSIADNGGIAAYGPTLRQVVYGPGYNRVDLSLSKTFLLWHETSLDFRADLYNALNTPTYGPPNTTVGSGFGQISSTRFGGSGIAAESPDARVAQFSAKLHF
jgi:Carboxypeptidase regulatory-like domain